jgi:hypothetical protein
MLAGVIDPGRRSPASTAGSRNARTAVPSMWVTPRSTARWMARTDSASSRPPPLVSVPAMVIAVDLSLRVPRRNDPGPGDLSSKRRPEFRRHSFPLRSPAWAPDRPGHPTSNGKTGRSKPGTGGAFLSSCDSPVSPRSPSGARCRADYPDRVPVVIDQVPDAAAAGDLDLPPLHPAAIQVSRRESAAQRMVPVIALPRCRHHVDPGLVRRARGMAAHLLPPFRRVVAAEPQIPGTFS